jgi:APA family basic amino acid/polyamine antiporter
MAAVAVTFARYFLEMALPISDSVLAAVVSVLTLINCLGVRAGSTVQSIFMVLKIIAILTLVVAGLLLIAPNAVAPSATGVLDRPLSFDLLTAIGAAMVPVLFAYGGWQTATFVAGEIKEPARNLSRGLILASRE